MRITFVVPRFHPNMRGLVGALIEGGHEVSMLVQQVADSAEEHDLVKPRVLKSAWRSTGQHRRSGRLKFLTLVRELKRAQPDVVIVRNSNRANVAMITGVSRLRSAKVIHYNQAP